jgi:hypothetical protein
VEQIDWRWDAWQELLLLGRRVASRYEAFADADGRLKMR